MTPETMLEHTYRNIRLTTLEHTSTRQQRLRVASLTNAGIQALCPDPATLQAVEALTIPAAHDWTAWHELRQDYDRHITPRLTRQWTRRILDHVSRADWQPELTETQHRLHGRSHHDGPHADR